MTKLIEQLNAAADQRHHTLRNIVPAVERLLANAGIPEIPADGLSVGFLNQKLAAKNWSVISRLEFKSQLAALGLLK